MAFMTSPSANSTNDVPTTYGVSTASTSSSTASTKVNTANLSDATVYAFLSNQSNGSQLIHEDLEQIHEDDLEEMYLKWQIAILSMRAKRFFQKTGRKITINGSDRACFDKSKSYMAKDEVPTNMALMAFSDSEIDLSYFGLEEFQQPEFQSYGPKSCETESKNASKEIPNELKESIDAPLVKNRVSDNKDCTVESPVVPLPADASPISASPNYVADSNPEEDLEDDQTDYPADRGDGDDESSDDDDDDVTDVEDPEVEPFEEDDEEEEEHLAPADSSALPIVDHVVPAGETEALEADEPTHAPGLPIIIPFSQKRFRRARKIVRPEPPMSASMKACIARHATLPLPPLLVPRSQIRDWGEFCSWCYKEARTYRV
nr:hypothetical protein [Tanacetum cinerariifolium]